MPDTKPTKEQVRDAVVLINTTLSTWESALKEGIDANEFKSVLLMDLQNVRKAMEVVTDKLGKQLN